ncbi:MAG: helix-turn-helix domain-containing protein [Defluviitaleaceae bacterium]|nr:helix-turn-helix domain-containing protein [Defluviitaleaceae bacterium]
MYQDFLAARITQLRLNLGVSARDMSLTLGQADNYINHIENKKSLPSMTSFFYICEYFKITPQEFFDEVNANPEKLNALVADIKRLDENTFTHIVGIVRAILGKKSGIK